MVRTALQAIKTFPCQNRYLTLGGMATPVLFMITRSLLVCWCGSPPAPSKVALECLLLSFALCATSLLGVPSNHVELVEATTISGPAEVSYRWSGEDEEDGKPLKCSVLETGT